MKKLKDINPTHSVWIYVSVSDLFPTFVTAWKTSEIETMCIKDNVFFSMCTLMYKRLICILGASSISACIYIELNGPWQCRDRAMSIDDLISRYIFKEWVNLIPNDKPCPLCDLM